MKKIVILIVCFLLSFFAACSNHEADQANGVTETPAVNSEAGMLSGDNKESEITPTADNAKEPEITTAADNAKEPEITTAADNAKESEVTPAADNANKSEITPTADNAKESEITPAADSAKEAAANIEPTVTPAIKDGAAGKYDTYLKITQNRPYAVGFSKDGVMYVVCAPETGDGTLYKVSASGEMTEICKVSGSFIGPGMVIDEDKIYITAGGELMCFSENGKSSVIADGFINAFDVTMDQDKNLYVADEKGETIYKVTSSGEKTVFVDYQPKTGTRFKLCGVEYNQKDQCLYAAYDKGIYRYPVNSAEGEIVYSGNEVVICLAADMDGNIFASLNSSIVKLEYDSLKSNIYKSDIGRGFIGINMGIGCFGEKTLYITANSSIITFN